MGVGGDGVGVGSRDASANPSFTQDIFTRHIRVDEYVLANITQEIFVPQDIFVYVL